MNDNDYVKFVKENENKPLSEIESLDIREKIIKAFACINSHKRKGEREYNEMYISNPKPPMAVFAYNMNNKRIDNLVEFIHNIKDRADFLSDYAKKHNIPFVVFGD